MRLREALQRSSHAAPVTESETERPVKPAAPSTMKPVAALCTAMLMLVMFIPGGQGHELVPPWQQLFMLLTLSFLVVFSVSVGGFVVLQALWLVGVAGKSTSVCALVP